MSNRLKFLSLVFVLFLLAPSATLAQTEVTCEQDVVVQANDWLSKLADKFYGDVLAYTAIVEATNAMAAVDDSYATIDNPDVIEPGWKLCIPGSEAAGQTVSQSLAAEAETSADRLRLGMTGDESTLTPYTYVTGYPGWNLLLLQYDSLYQLDSTGAPQPWLATNSTTAEDGMSVTLDLRQDVTWHDGRPFTAADVAFTVDYFKEFTQSRFTRDLRPVESAEALDDYQIQFNLVAPTPAIELSIFADLPIIPAHVWSTVDNPDEYAPEDGTNIGTGPYQLVEYNPDQFYRFEANANYFAGQPTIAELVVIEYANDAGAIAAFQAGEVDMLIEAVPPEQIALLQAQPGLEIAQGPLFSTEMINYNLDRAPFDQLAVRQAISLALDRQDIIDTIYLGAATPGSSGWIHPASPFFNEAVVTEYDPDRAQAILDEAGLTDSDGDGIRELDGEPIAFEILSPSNNSIRLRLAELVREMLLAIGLDAQVSSVEQGTWEEAVWPGFDVSQGRNYDMAMWGWSAPVQANPIRVTSLIHSDPALGSINLTGYQSEEMDALSEALNTELSANERARLLREIQALIAADLPFVMIAYPDGAYAYRANLYDGWIFMAGQGVFHKLSFLPPSAQPR